MVSLCIRHRATTAHMLATPPEVLSDSVTLMFINASEGSENANICDSSDCSVSDTRQSSPSSPGGGGAERRRVHASQHGLWGTYV